MSSELKIEVFKLPVHETEQVIYEMPVLFSPHLSQDKIRALVDDFQAQLKKDGGEILFDRCEYWGLRNLESEIKKEQKRFRKAHYVLLYISMEPSKEKIHNFAHYLSFRCREQVLRFLQMRHEGPFVRSPLFESDLDQMVKNTGASRGFVAQTSKESEEQAVK